MVTITVMEPEDIDKVWFDKIIMVDKGYSDKTEDIVFDVKMTKKKINVEQSEMLTLFMKDHPDFKKGKQKACEATETLNKEWEKLASELNVMGPPTHSSSEWRRVWTNMKSNKKKKCESDSVFETTRPNIDVASVVITKSASCTVSVRETVNLSPIPESTCGTVTSPVTCSESENPSPDNDKMSESNNFEWNSNVF